MPFVQCRTCGRLLPSTSRSTYCADHKPAKRKTFATRIRSTSRWQQIRELALERDAYRCTFAEPDEHGVMTTCGRRQGLEVHHVKPIERGGEPFDLANLRTYCSRHHRRVEAELEKGGSSDGT